MSNKQVIVFYIISSPLLLVNAIGDALYKLSIAGYWSDRIMYWLWFFGTFYNIIKYWKKLATKLYFGILIVG